MIPPNSGPINGLKILVVDDDRLIVKMLFDFLTAEGNTCDSAKNGKEGFQKVLEDHFDLIVMDVQMPEMNGIDCIRAIRQVDTQVPILVISADSAPDSLKTLLLAKENAFFQKPFSPDELTIAVQALLLKAGDD